MKTYDHTRNHILHRRSIIGDDLSGEANQRGTVMTTGPIITPMKLGDAFRLVAAIMREQGEPEMASAVEQAIRTVDALPHLLDACGQAAILCDDHADGAPDSPAVALDCNRVGEVIEKAIIRATQNHQHVKLFSQT